LGGGGLGGGGGGGGGWGGGGNQLKQIMEKIRVTVVLLCTGIRAPVPDAPGGSRMGEKRGNGQEAAPLYFLYWQQRASRDPRRKKEGPWPAGKGGKERKEVKYESRVKMK